MSKFDQFKLFCTIQLQNIDQREIQLRRELQELNIQREYLVEFLQDLQSNFSPSSSEFSESEIQLFRTLLIKTEIE
tara:strand:- start:895 stop:1122 length:228 start_codon:yes stop_codon:yes gene_type:complete